MAAAVYLAALRAGLGPRARDVVDALPTACGPPSREARGCVDGGSSVLLGLSAPGGRVFHAQVRRACTDPDVQRWACVSATPGGTPRRWERTVHTGDAYWAARAAAGDRADEFDRLHTAFGPLARVHRVACGPEIGWRLHPGVRLDALGPALGDLLAAAGPILDDLHGFAVTGTTGPWSVSARFTDDGTRFALGTSRWAYTVEDDRKRRRLTRWIDALGGDARHAEAVYHLANGYRGDTRGVRVGRAVEVAVDGGRVHATAYLAVPSLGKEDHP